MLAGKKPELKADDFINSEAKSNDLCFTIEGNIGCGKSTFLEILKQRITEAQWIEEPVEEWQNLGQNKINLLDRYYTEPTRWGFTFQIYAIFTRIRKFQQTMKAHPQKLKISERSILADKYVFSQLMKDNGYMNQSQYQVFKCLYSSFESMTSQEKTKIIYLRCTPQKCQQRIKQRLRPQEKVIPLQYLEKIHVKHENWFKSHDPKNVLIIDTSEDFKNDENKIQGMIKELRDFMNS